MFIEKRTQLNIDPRQYLVQQNLRIYVRAFDARLYSERIDDSAPAVRLRLTFYNRSKKFDSARIK